MDTATYNAVATLYRMVDETAGERFTRLMQEKGVGTRQLGRLAGVSHGTIQNFRHRGLGESSHDTVVKIAAALGVTPTNLRRIVSGLPPISESENAKLQRYEVHPNWIRFPVYGSVSAGDSTADPLEEDVAYIPKEHLTRHGANLDAVRTFVVNGRCMISPEAMKVDRTYAPGDYVACDTSKQPDVGDVVVAWWDERDLLVIKRYGVEQQGIVLTPIAPGHPSVVLPEDAHVNILGPVVWRGG